MPRPLSLIALVSLVACSSATAPPLTISGTWAAFAQPAAGFNHLMDIAGHGAAVSGTGTYSRELGRSGTFTIAGSYVAPNLTVQFSYDDGRISQFSAQVSDGQMTGRESFDGVTDGLDFTKH